VEVVIDSPEVHAQASTMIRMDEKNRVRMMHPRCILLIDLQPFHYGFPANTRNRYLS